MVGGGVYQGQVVMDGVLAVLQVTSGVVMDWVGTVAEVPASSPRVLVWGCDRPGEVGCGAAQCPCLGSGTGGGVLARSIRFI